MTLTDPKLILSFEDDEIQTKEQEVLSESIAKGSLRFRYQILDGLNSSSNQVTLQLTRNCTSIADIIRTDKDVHAVLLDGVQILFTGYLSTNHSWSVTEHGEQAFNITLEGVGTRLLSRSFISSGHHLFDCTADAAIRAICSAYGIAVSSSMPVLNDRILKVVEASQSGKDILSKLVYELGYVYYFDNLGRLSLFKIDCTSLSGIRTLDADDLVCRSGKAVSLSRSIRQYDSSRVSYSELGRAEDYLVYRNITAQDESHPYCNLELPSGGHFDGSEIYTAYEWSQELFDEFRESALIEACNASSETAVVGSNDILAVSNVRCDSEKQNDVTCNISSAGGPYLLIDVQNGSSQTAYVTRLDAYADIVYQKSTGVVRGGDGGNELSEDLEYVHDRTLAQRHANLLCNYHRYCSSRYTFYLREDIPLGTIVRLYDNAFSGLDVNVLLISKEISDASDVVSYTAVGISVFDLDRELFHRSTEKAPVPLIGPKGPKGDAGNPFYAYVSRNVIDCFRNRTPVDNTPVRLTVTVADASIVPELLINGTAIDMSLDSSSADTVDWIYDIDPNLDGSDICQICVDVQGMKWTTTLSKNVPNDSQIPDLFVPVDYVLVRQFCYGSKSGPEERWVGDSANDLSGSSDFVSDIGWVDAEDGECPLKPRSGMYIWLRQGTYDPSTETQPTGWTVSLYDTPYLRFDFTISQRTYVRNLRDLASKNEIYIYPNIFGYDASTLVVTASNRTAALPYDANYSRYVLSFGYNEAPLDAVTITASLGTKIWAVDLRCEDLTERHCYFGLRSSVPDTFVLDGDSYTVNDSTSADHMRVMVYSESDNGWHYLSDPDLSLDGITVSEISAKASMDVLRNIQSGTLTQSDYSYFNTVIAGVVTADYIGAKQIQVQDQGHIFGGSVDPTAQAGQRVSNQGFIIDSDGIIEAYQAILKQAKVLGQMDFSDADILHPCFTTVPAVGTDLATYSIPSPTHWHDGNISFSSLTANAITAVSNSYYGSTSISNICRVTNPSTVVVESGTYLFQGFVYARAGSTSYTIQYGGTYSIDIHHNSTFWGQTFSKDGEAYVLLNGTRILYTTTGGGYVYWTGALKAGDELTFCATCATGGDIDTDCNNYHLRATEVTLRTCGMTESGRWYQQDNQYGAWIKIGSDYHPKETRMYINGIFDSDTRIRYLYLNNIVTSYMSSLDNGKVYNVTGSLTLDGNTTIVPSFITKNGNIGTLVCYAGTVKYELSLSDHDFYWLTGSLKIVSSTRGLQTKAIYPDTTLTYDLGSYDLQFRNIYCQAVNPASRRSLKTNIEPFVDNALDIIGSVDVVKYNFKADFEDNSKNQVIDYIGFIADDTDSRLAGKGHDRMIEINCIGILIKALQELSAKVETLEGKLRKEENNGQKINQ